MAHDSGCAVWCFDLDLRGACVQGLTVDEALEAFTRSYGQVTINGDEQAFARDRRPATDQELALTQQILTRQRARAVRLLAVTPSALLDVEDLGRGLPEWATWRSIRDMFWHICDTESRYYLPRCGLPARARAATLEQELETSGRHVHDVLEAMDRDIDIRRQGEEWTTNKLLRRLAWHEAGELDVIKGMLAGK